MPAVGISLSVVSGVVVSAGLCVRNFPISLSVASGVSVSVGLCPLCWGRGAYSLVEKLDAMPDDMLCMGRASVSSAGLSMLYRIRGACLGGVVSYCTRSARAWAGCHARIC